MEELIKKNWITAPGSYWQLTEQQRADVSNGCGPAGWGWLVPDKFRLMGVDFSPSCDVHDYMYAAGYGKGMADSLFLENNSYIASQAHYGFKILAGWLSFIFYLAVKNGGAGAYNNAKTGV